MIEVFIERWNTGFSVRTPNVSMINALHDFNRRYNSPKIDRVRGRVVVVPGDDFFVHDKRRDQFVYIKAAWDEVKGFLDHMKARFQTPVKITIQNKQSKKKGDKVVFDRHNLTLVETDEYWMWQNDATDLALLEGREHTVLEVQTGRGKTKSAMKYMVKLGERVLVITKAGYVDKWQGDLLGGLKLRPGEFVRIKDLEELEDLLLIAHAGRMNSTGKGDKDIKVILISSHCIDNYIQKWCGDEFFKVSPYDFIEKLGIGLTVYDESHQLFRMNFWSFIMMDHCHVLDLSATLEPDQDFMKERYKERFPKEARFELEYDAYVEMYGIYFNWKDHKALTRLNRMSMYNHTEFEKLIMKKKSTETEYFSMLNRMLIPWFFENWKPGQRALVLFATKEMCTRFSNYLKTRHPGKRVERYIQGDKYDVAKLGDVIVSTRGKSGTAVDYEGLVLNVTTVAVDDTQASLQILGRTRKTTLIQWGIVPKIVFPVCRQVRKQVDYYKRKLKKFEGKVSKAVTMGSSFVIH